MRQGDAAQEAGRATTHYQHLSLSVCSSLRLSCYKCITDTMQELVNQSKAAPQSPSVPKQPGPPVMTSDPNMLSNEEATAHVSSGGLGTGGWAELVVSPARAN